MMGHPLQGASCVFSHSPGALARAIHTQTSESPGQHVLQMHSLRHQVLVHYFHSLPTVVLWG